ncbi:hypothetical protein LXL04_014018 [Taraxacum kok-saghyz]
MATTDSDGGNQLHVVMFPWLAFGHIIPYLQLSKSIAQKGHKVSFLSTSRNIQRLPKLPDHLSPLITLIPLTLPRLHQLPEDAEATMDVRTEDIHYLKKAFDGLQPEVTRFLEAESPDWIIYDFAPYWLPEIAAGLGISRGYFPLVNAWFMAFVGWSPEDMINDSDYRTAVEDFLVPPKWVPFPSKICYRRYEANWMVGSGSRDHSGVSDAYRGGMMLKGSNCVFIRYCYEFEPQWLTLLEELHHLPVIPVGLMPPAITAEVGDRKDDTWLTIKNWLDGQQKGHVVFVGLGSEVMLSKTELGELALGLELSGLPFFWALRKPAGCTESDSVELPDGFLERIRNRGMVWTKWVPQLQILSHESVGGFLTHCGWSSIVEGLMFGHPLIMLPFLVDQGLNARALVDKKVGVEVARNEQNGSFTKNSVADSLSSVVVKDEGRIYKENAMALSRIFGDIKLQQKYTDDFVDYLEKHINSNECKPDHRYHLHFTPAMSTTDSDGSNKQLHVAMFPWLAFGHIIPFLQLSKSIAQKGHKVSFLSTTRNIQRLPILPSNLSPLITLVPLTLPRLHQLPEDAEATMDVTTEDIQYLKKAFDGLQPEVTRFLEAESPDWVIYDFAPYWLPEIADGLGISHAFFSIVNAWFIAFAGRSPEEMINGSDYRKSVADFMVPPNWVSFPTKICYRRHEAEWVVDSNTPNASGVSDKYRLGMAIKGSKCLFIRDCFEFDPPWLTLVEELHHVTVVPVGLMPPSTAVDVQDTKNDTWLTIKNWLDSQQKGHVVYVALGSEVMLSKTDIGELALGLEQSGLPFFWAYRKPPGSTESDSVDLPDGFLERVCDRGMVWTSWVPQLEILSHESVGSFLTHCGWSSIVEGLMFGRPLIMLPFLVDQGLNARALVDKMVGIEVPRNEKDGSFTKNSVADSLSSVVIKDEGRVYKDNAIAVSRIFGDMKVQQKYSDEFIDYLEKHRSER